MFSRAGVDGGLKMSRFVTLVTDSDTQYIPPTRRTVFYNLPQGLPTLRSFEEPSRRSLS